MTPATQVVAGVAEIFHSHAIVDGDDMQVGRVDDRGMQRVVRQRRQSLDPFKRRGRHDPSAGPDSRADQIRDWLGAFLTSEASSRSDCREERLPAHARHARSQAGRTRPPGVSILGLPRTFASRR